MHILMEVGVLKCTQKLFLSSVASTTDHEVAALKKAFLPTVLRRPEAQQAVQEPVGKQLCQKVDMGEERHEQKPMSRGEAGRKAEWIRTDSCDHVPAPWLQRLLLVAQFLVPM